MLSMLTLFALASQPAAGSEVELGIAQTIADAADVCVSATIDGGVDLDVLETRGWQESNEILPVRFEHMTFSKESSQARILVASGYAPFQTCHAIQNIEIENEIEVAARQFDEKFGNHIPSEKKFLTYMIKDHAIILAMSKDGDQHVMTSVVLPKKHLFSR
ncbi:hypothetical protein ACRAQ7_11285 [Erythrobacter sp. W53]|uniref:hypothetical protein n=1 Tax=Erythrobacter sp. W53 TaxID=3425947 RepID=UPI003D768F59